MFIQMIIGAYALVLNYVRIIKSTYAEVGAGF